MDYTTQMTENMLRSYFSLEAHPDTLFSDMKMDLDKALKSLKSEDRPVYDTVMGVFVAGTPIQEQALKDKISKRQVHYRMASGIASLTVIMNGDTNE